MKEGFDFTYEVNTSMEGALREALATLGNFEQLLRSRNVAPKSIVAVLPDIKLCCEPLLSNLDQMRRISTRTLSEEQDQCTKIGQFLRKHVDDLELALTVPPKRALSARHRLQLESTVMRARRRMSGILPLLQLCRDAPRHPCPQIDVGELLLLCRSGDQPTTPHSRQVLAKLAIVPGSYRLVASPRAVLNLIGLIGALVSHKSPDNKELRIALTSTVTSRRLSIQMGSCDGPELPLVLPPIVEPTDAAVRSATRLLGLEVVDEPGAVHLSWTAPSTG